MSDQGFGSYAAATQQPVGDFVVNLNFGLETTGGLAGGRIPVGMHTLLVTELRSQYTKNAEQAAVIKVKVVSSNNPEAMGTEKEEWLTIPGEVRKQNDPEKWQTMMRMFRQRLEAITGKHWRSDDMTLRGSDILGRKFVATAVATEDKVTQPDGSVKTYTNVNLTDWQALHMQGNGGQQAFAEAPTAFAAAPAPAQPMAAPQPAAVPQPAAAPPPADGPGFGSLGTPTATQPNTTFNPAEEPF